MGEEDKIEEDTVLSSSDSADILVSDLIAKAQAYLASIPEEVRSRAFVRLEVFGDYARGIASFGRPKTLAEIEAERRARAWR